MTLLRLRDDKTAPFRGRSPSRDPQSDGEAERLRMLCRGCKTPISDRSFVFGPAGAPPVQVFTNPEGRVCEVLTVHRAESLLFVGPATTEHTWFVGYAWRVALCAQCLRHLGWRYEAVAEALPPVFFGLLSSELVEE
jgi:hypothetical protein